VIDELNKAQRESIKKFQERCSAIDAEVKELKAHVRFLREEHISALEARDKAREENTGLKMKLKDLGIEADEPLVEESDFKDAAGDAEKPNTRTRK
jgi:chromosome segregation ATPase